MYIINTITLKQGGPKSDSLDRQAEGDLPLQHFGAVRLKSKATRSGMQMTIWAILNKNYCYGELHLN